MSRFPGAQPETALAKTWYRAASLALAPLGRRLYDLRHTAVSLWLNSGVPATEVARRTGHGGAVLLIIYAHCIDGQATAANQRRYGLQPMLILGDGDRLQPPPASWMPAQLFDGLIRRRGAFERQ